MLGFLRKRWGVEALRPLHKALLGAAIGIAGVIVTFLYTGIYLIADCGPDCVARGERTVVGLLIVLGLAMAGGGGFLFASATRGASRKPRARKKPGR